MTKLYYPFNKVLPLYTIVQHSGYGYADKPGFREGLEERCVTTNNQMKKIIKAGGILFKDYKRASEYCMKEQYPPEAGMYPRAPGNFSLKKVDGLRIYTPLDKSEADKQGAITGLEKGTSLAGGGVS